MNNAYETLKRNYLNMLDEMDVVYYDPDMDQAAKAISLHAVMDKYAK